MAGKPQNTTTETNTAGPPQGSPTATLHTRCSHPLSSSQTPRETPTHTTRQAPPRPERIRTGRPVRKERGDPQKQHTPDRPPPPHHTRRTLRNPEDRDTGQGDERGGRRRGLFLQDPTVCHPAPRERTARHQPGEASAPARAKKRSVTFPPMSTRPPARSAGKDARTPRTRPSGRGGGRSSLERR